MPDKILTEKQRLFLDALAGDANGDVRTAMRIAGYSDNTRLGEVYDNLTDEIIVIANKLLAINSLKASLGLIDGLVNPATPFINNKITAAKEILDRIGIVKKEVKEDNKQDNAIFILPPKDTKSIKINGKEIEID